MDDKAKNSQDPYEILFVSFISMFYNSGIQQLGKIMNPLTGKIQKDLSAVQSTIEILKMLKIKTEGNLSSQEKSVLESSISNLQLNYVEEAQAEDKNPKEGKA